jgi:hypothetical protein
MSCPEEFEVLLSRFVDGELSSDERLRLDEHLSGCEPCRQLLSIFQKNENILAGALSSEAFGYNVVESVLTTIKKESPPEARPVEEGPMEWVRSRPWLQLAAAAVLVIGLFGVQSASHNAQLREMGESLKKQQEALAAQTQTALETKGALQAQMQQSRTLAEQYSELLCTNDVRKGFQGASPRSIWAYVEPEHYLVVMARFDGKDFSSYNVYRRLESERAAAFAKINKEPLARPEFVDRAAKPGQTYVYKFEAVRPTGETLDSVPMTMRLSPVGDLAPEQSVRVHCEECGKQLDNAIFQLERLINGKPVSERFYVKLNERVGGIREVPGVGKVDFTTDLVLAKIDEGTQFTTTSYTRPELDDQGNFIYEKIFDGTLTPVTKRYDMSVGSRQNLRAFFRPVGTTSTSLDDFLWKDGWMRVRARD